MDLSKRLAEKINIPYDTVIKLFNEGVITEVSIRNYLIRADFDVALKSGDYDLIKQIFIDLSIEYDISDRQARRIVYDYMKNKK